MEALPPLGVVRPAHKVVKGHVEVVREGDEDGCGWFALTIFVKLIHCFSDTSSFGGLFLSDFEGFAKSSERIGKLHVNTSEKFKWSIDT